MLGRKSNAEIFLCCCRGTWSANVSSRGLKTAASVQHVKRQRQPTAPRSKAPPPIAVIRAALLDSNLQSKTRRTTEKYAEPHIQNKQRNRHEKLDLHETLLNSAAQWARKVSNDQKIRTLVGAYRDSRPNETHSRDLFRDQSIWALKNARIFEDIMDGLALVLHAPIDCHPLDDISEALLAALDRCIDNGSIINRLTALNALSYQIRREGHKLPADICVQGMQSAADNGSVHALQRYLLEFSKQGGTLSSENLRQILRQLNVQPVTGPESKFLGGPSDALALLTGESQSGIKDDLEAPGVSLRGFLDQRKSEVYGDYLDALARLKADEKVWQEWLRWERHEKGDRQKEGTQSTDPMPSLFAKSLLQAGDPRHAWMVVAESAAHPALPVQRPSVWLDLLDYPEHMNVWPKGMDAVVLEKYDQLLSEIERVYGIKWTGGEDGSHIPAPDADEDMHLLLAEEL
ncbi:hypothetical protein L228DRAFT_248464 [Xylona heveae TC161]|uniref:Uncharacterized protein n=1 Tax=Xylona heveae (strain CBS 132557 / TC161) TaxID=1328760 RepID=A0A165G4P2_XYLHT|nr:hypothetical protein L228DRAFT_248464 [Xylona heveae TC161]KZF21735.1 hypothetical protein L228DRAFT_248464 [Xylona heveae TC161]